MSVTALCGKLLVSWSISSWVRTVGEVLNPQIVLWLFLNQIVSDFKSETAKVSKLIQIHLDLYANRQTYREVGVLPQDFAHLILILIKRERLFLQSSTVNISTSLQNLRAVVISTRCSFSRGIEIRIVCN